MAPLSRPKIVSGPDVTRLGPTSFNLGSVGTYQIFFQVSIDEPAQLVVTLGGVEQAYTVVGRATGTSQLVGMCLIANVISNTSLTIRNPSSNTTALTITPVAGVLNMYQHI